MRGMPDLDELLRDLAAEHADLEGLLMDRDEAEWDRPTPAPGWSVKDQVSHLAFFDEQAALAVADPDAFQASLVDIATDIQGFMDRGLLYGRKLDPIGMLDWWRTARRDMLDAFAKLEPGTRVPWFGPPMSPASFISARLMETWAHGQDVADALDVDRVPTVRLEHVAFIGVRARPFSYVTNNMAQPPEPVYVELTGPSGETWAFGERAHDSVTGPAEDFCLVVTQRRHLDDTALVVSGPAATEWMSIAQCFAGPPGEGRKAGQFRKTAGA